MVKNFDETKWKAETAAWNKKAVAARAAGESASKSADG